MHRQILLSNAYQQSSVSPLASAAMEKDPENKLLWKFSRRRLQAEEIRDAMLIVSGMLNDKQGGPSIIVLVDQFEDGVRTRNWIVVATIGNHIHHRERRDRNKLAVDKSVQKPLMPSCEGLERAKARYAKAATAC